MTGLIVNCAVIYTRLDVYNLFLIFQEHVDDIIYEPLSGELKVVALNIQQVQSASLVQCLESNPVLGVERRLSQWHDHLSLARHIELAV